MKIQVRRGEQELGSYSAAELLAKLKAGEIQPTDSAKHSEVDEWIPIRNLPADVMKAAFGPPAIPTPNSNCESGLSPQPMDAYHSVPKWRFIVMNLCTFSLYSFYWAYKNWKYIKLRDQSDIWPFWRAFFAPIWTYALALDIMNVRGFGERDAKSQAAVVSAIYFLLCFASDRLSDPYWFIASLMAFVPIAALNNRALQINSTRIGPSYKPAGLRFRHWVVLLTCGPVFALVTLDEIGITEGQTVLTGAELAESSTVDYLRKHRLLGDGEEIVYFYSDSLFSFEDEGVMLTDRHLTYYWREAPEEALDVASIDLAALASIDVIEAQSVFDTTTVIAFDTNDSVVSFEIFDADEAGRDTYFIEELRDRVRVNQFEPPMAQ